MPTLRIYYQIFNLKQSNFDQISHMSFPFTSNIRFRVANITFLQEVSKQKIDQQVKQSRKYFKIEDCDWRKSFQEYRKSNMSKIFKYARKILIQRIELHFTKQSKILRNISHIQFPKLKSLYLCGNKIQSIQSIQLCNFPVLQQIDLRDNKITTIRSMRKCQLNSLKTVQLFKSCLNKHKTVQWISKFGSVRSISTSLVQYSSSNIKKCIEKGEQYFKDQSKNKTSKLGLVIFDYPQYLINISQFQSEITPEKFRSFCECNLLAFQLDDFVDLYLNMSTSSIEYIPFSIQFMQLSNE